MFESCVIGCEVDNLTALAAQSVVVGFVLDFEVGLPAVESDFFEGPGGSEEIKGAVHRNEVDMGEGGLNFGGGFCIPAMSEVVEDLLASSGKLHRCLYTTQTFQYLQIICKLQSAC